MAFIVLFFLLAALAVPPTPAAAAGVNPKLCRSAVLCTGACRQACNALTAAKIASLVETYPAGWTDDRLAAELFTPNAALAVTPIGAFEGGLTALEYVTTFSRQSVRGEGRPFLPRGGVCRGKKKKCAETKDARAPWRPRVRASPAPAMGTGLDMSQ